MATVNIVLTSVQSRADTGATIPVAHSRKTASENITSSASSQQSTTVAPTQNGDLVWVVTVTGGHVRLEFAASPTATATGWLVLDGQTRDFAAVDGDKVAVINA